ncbi:MAG: hypothetical protein NTV70_05810 [Acidobacteria bacterium]|nr:hypothetical protein [Acidobacteriota bacterium]
MTKVQVNFELTRPMDDAVMDAIAKATSIYGIHHVKLSSAMDRVTVEYDASRLRPAHVESRLEQLGIPLRRVD